MYASKILNTIMQGDSSGFTAIGDKDHIVFDDEQDLLFYRLLYKYFVQFDKVPSSDYLEDFFDLEKDNLAQKAFVALIDEDAVSEDLAALIKTQIHYNVKQKTIELTSGHQQRIKLGNTSDIKDMAYEYQAKVSELNQLLDENEHKRGLLYGEDVGDKFRKKYEQRRDSEEGYYVGKFGISAIDNVAGGINSVDKITILGFTNQGKSPAMRQIVYNLIMQGLNVMVISLEMDFNSIETSFYTLHANNYQVFGMNTPKITTKAVREGTMSEEEEDYLFDTVIQDFNTNDQYGSLYVLQPENQFCMDDLIMEVNKVNMTEMPLDALMLDYAVPLIQPEKKGSNFGKEEYNAMHRRLRLFGLTFDHGRGLPILDACQANRNGYLEAISPKNPDHLYNLGAIGDYNSIEKDSTQIISILQTEEMKAEGLIQYQHLKSRESKLFAPFKAQLDGATGYIRETIAQDFDEDEIDSAISELEL